MTRPHHLALAATAVLATFALPQSVLADARVSRSGNVITLTSDARGDAIHNAGVNNRRFVSFYVERGRVLRTGPGCMRLRGPEITRVVVTCGAPSQTQVNRVTLRVELGGGDDSFTAAPWDDVQPRIIADGGAGNDTIHGSTNADEIDGGAGDDRIEGLDGVDDLDGGDGADVILGGAADDSVVGGAGIDAIYGDNLRPTTSWGIDLVTAVDQTADRISCGEGDDAAVIDADDVTESNCENLAGGRSTPPRDQTGTLPLTVTIGALADTPGGLARILRGEPIRLPVTFSAAAEIVAKLRLSAGEARRLGVPTRERVIADDIGTLFTFAPVTINTLMRLRWPARPYLRDDDRVRATLTITARDVNGATTIATRDITLRR